VVFSVDFVVLIGRRGKAFKRGGWNPAAQGKLRRPAADHAGRNARQL